MSVSEGDFVKIAVACCIDGSAIASTAQAIPTIFPRSSRKFHSRWLSTEGRHEELLLFTKRFKPAVMWIINQPMRIFEFKILPPPKV